MAGIDHLIYLIFGGIACRKIKAKELVDVVFRLVHQQMQPLPGYEAAHHRVWKHLIVGVKDFHVKLHIPPMYARLVDLS